MAAPVICYTDIINGPASGGENGDGTYLSVFGYNFGADISALSCTINGTAVAQKMYLGASNGRSGVQQFSVQVASGTTTGAIQVSLGGQNSNTDHTFTVMSGRILFFSTSGNNGTGSPGNIALPYRDPNYFLDDGGIQAGDALVMRGGTWDASGYGSFYFHNITGTSTGWLSLIAYPGETVTIDNVAQVKGSAINAYRNGGSCDYVQVAGFHANMRGVASVVFSAGNSARYWRIVNCEGQGIYENGGGAAAIDGSGKYIYLLGNHIHDNDGSKLYHSLYLDSRAAPDNSNICGPYEVAWNHIHHQKGGRGVQIYGDAANGKIRDVSIHHNLVHDIHLDGILLSRQTDSGCKVYNNVIYNVGDDSLVHPTTDDGGGGCCIRLASTPDSSNALLTVEVYNNTCGGSVDNTEGESGGIMFQDVETCTLRNNLVYDLNNYVVDSNYSTLTSSNNLWYGSGSAPAFDSSPRTGNPQFVDAGAGDFRCASNGDGVDHGSSAVSSVVTNDFLAITRPQNSVYDIGAYEYVNAALLAGPTNVRWRPH